MENNTSLEIFAQETKYPISQNVVETLEKIKEVRNNLIETFKLLCFSDDISQSIMNFRKETNKINYYFPNEDKNDQEIIYEHDKEYFSIPEQYRCKLNILNYNINNEIFIFSKERVKDHGFKIIEKDILKLRSELNFTQKIESFFGVRFYKKQIENTFNIIKEKEYYIESFDIKQSLSKEDFELLSCFFEEQKQRKILNSKINSFDRLKNKIIDKSFSSEELN